VRSIRRFVSAKGYQQLMVDKGFHDVRVKSLDLGLCYAVAGAKGE
jgi:ubiquinone/menaquinone biosynthesis C-methylase UbiE